MKNLLHPSSAKTVDSLQRIQFRWVSIIVGLTACALLLAVNVSQAEPVAIDLGQIAIEEAEVEYSLESSNTGSLTALCPGCVSAITLEINTDSEAWIDNRLGSFAEAAQLSDSFTGVVYDPADNTVVILLVTSGL